ncbi:aspartyl/asparaginyl beta-hydroxylase domain-containing protein [Mucilaginibacter sp. HMF5004]|uniref:aspartyl/asparaginyl beta-hydroxylase domain-containing protein n=1 Tax=Mucilaginibacter rivuli TaxID=2857527 RepID=UPI001C5DD682|nr:aspartyl/asparaginyl beta-hydroxylase domain-containing protein [Mucilaginibacter rivuli]MBW4889833.1 aspartyl/asparaginyl beta-hydroxylase domain-containing protein [Mucilaginibacter rivuli]
MIIGYAQLNIGVPYIAPESILANGTWLPHFNTNGYEGSWEVLTLRSPGGKADNIFADLVGADVYLDTPLMAQYPAIKQICDNLHCDLMSVRLLNLKAGAIIKQHRDNELAFEKGEARLHFPIVTNNKVEFFVNDQPLIMLPGQCWYINANMPHRASNNGTTNRIHLVIDCKVNDWLRDVFEKADRTEFEEHVDVHQTMMVINALRGHQTHEANNMADELQLKLDKHLQDTHK